MMTGGNGDEQIKEHRIKHVAFAVNQVIQILAIYPFLLLKGSAYLWGWYVLVSLMFVLGMFFAHREGNRIPDGVMNHVVEPALNVIQIITAALVTPHVYFTVFNTFAIFGNLVCCTYGRGAFVDSDFLNLLRLPWTHETYLAMTLGICAEYLLVWGLHYPSEIGNSAFFIPGMIASFILMYLHAHVNEKTHISQQLRYEAFKNAAEQIKITQKTSTEVET
eukprot:CAMPEP_0198143088 /NCGR_PEP_ID=MMETSP1443-20131203/5741_1 /TAXON_ID=186043 /ORGANISM="Entomoneis sp., Strain CCMP2396" /LENGTH=219 /DNA_ID=CAMNT_0043806229 /DNA_START=233 /DNA_END=892 /DNA_ORIENTATION=+